MSTEAKKAAAEEAITKEALTRYQATTDPRLREIILSLIKHLHGFARDVRLTGGSLIGCQPGIIMVPCPLPWITAP